MSDPVRCWLVEREYTDKGLLSLMYATPDGERAIHKQRSAVGGAPPVTAATEIDPAKLDAVEDPERRERYRHECERMAERHDPDDEV